MITSIILEWFSCSCRCVDDLSRTKLTVYRNGNRIIYEEYAGNDDVIRKNEGRYSRLNGDRFFIILEECREALTRNGDYSVNVCDGSRWKLTLRHSDNTIRKLEGTVDYPPHGRRLEQELHRLCMDAGIMNPYMFGCDGVPVDAAREFAEKWIGIFTEVPQNADSLFEREMGNDCFALGFEMDSGRAFIREYSNGQPINSAEELEKVINNVDDIELLGSAIFSFWRGITHWSCGSGFTDNNKAWFLTALTRLRELLGK